MTFFNVVKIKVKFDGCCPKQEKITFCCGTSVKVAIIFEINLWLNDLDSKFTILNYLFSAVKFTKNANPDKYSYSEYVIRFDVHDYFKVR